LAREAITEYVKTGNTIEEGGNYSGILNSKCGAFVSIHKKGHLRGCLGHLEGNVPLWQLIKDMSVAAVSRDRRFEPVTIDELPELEIEISVLSPLKKISSPDEFELGKHGIFIQKDDRSGTFLPQVAHKTNWTKEEFLGHCSRDKAGLGWDDWRTADLYIFEATVFEE
jgi:MEMO1 family protein